MSNKDIQKLDDKALEQFVAEKREAVRAFRFSNAGSATRNVKQARNDKKDIARALTEQTTRTRTQSNEEAK